MLKKFPCQVNKAFSENVARQATNSGARDFDFEAKKRVCVANY